MVPFYIVLGKLQIDLSHLEKNNFGKIGKFLGFIYTEKGESFFKPSMIYLSLQDRLISYILPVLITN